MDVRFQGIRPIPLLPGYHNATLGITGVAVLVPDGASGFDVQVDAGCFIGVRNESSVGTFNDANYGSILIGGRYFLSGSDWDVANSPTLTTFEPYIHIAPWATTANVAIVFF